MITVYEELAGRYKQCTLWQEDAVRGRPEPAIQVRTIEGEVITLRQGGEEIYLHVASAADLIEALQHFAREPMAKVR